MHVARLIALLGAGSIFWPGAVRAAPEEIQVYINDMDEAGQVGLDVHLNDVLSGTSTRDDYPGAQDSLHRVRVTPEFSYGASDHVELGLYLPLATVDRDGRADLGGVKVRVKYIAPERAGQRWWYGANFEVGRVDHRLDQNPWNAELKGIAGAKFGSWLVAFNANIDFVVAGPRPSPASFDFDTKLGYAVSRKLTLGVESYNGVGALQQPFRFGSSDQLLLAAVDAAIGRFDLNLGAGRGFGSSPDHLVVKAIIGIPLDQIFRPRHRKG